ncbi:MAG: hypothetical protein GEU97_05160 [Actinophytocola sp.]|nr:hypothetical protein [Actinophytocola sp.]
MPIDCQRPNNTPGRVPRAQRRVPRSCRRVPRSRRRVPHSEPLYSPYPAFVSTADGPRRRPRRDA